MSMQEDAIHRFCFLFPVQIVHRIDKSWRLHVWHLFNGPRRQTHDVWCSVGGLVKNWSLFHISHDITGSSNKVWQHDVTSYMWYVPAPIVICFRSPCNRSWINSWFQSQKCNGVRKPWENEKRQFQIDKFTCTISYRFLHSLFWYFV